MTDDERQIVGRATLEGLAVDASLEIDGDLITLARLARHLGEVRSLLAHRLEHGIEISVRDRGCRALDREFRDGLHGELRKDLDEGRVAHLGRARCRELLDARIGGGFELLARDRLGIGLADEIAHDLGLHLLGVLLTHDR